MAESAEADIKCCTAILSSEPLTPIREEWMPIAPNSIVLCGRTRGESWILSASECGRRMVLLAFNSLGDLASFAPLAFSE